MIKPLLKRIGAARWVNAKIKCAQMKRRYEDLCRRYGTPSVLSDPAAIVSLTSKLWSSRPQPDPLQRRPRILFVGTDEQQDTTGMLQAFQRHGDVIVFEHAPGAYGQRWPRSEREFDSVRTHNGDVLRRYVDRERFDVIAGQMWGLSMHWRALAEARERGIAVVNIGMDDRHSFAGLKFGDGTEAGTRGLARHLSLACTDAAECVAWFEAEGCRSMYFPEASDPEIFPGASAENVADVSFVGARYGIRETMVRKLQAAGVAVAAYGSGWPNGRIDRDAMVRLMRGSRIILGCGTVGHCDDFVALKLRDFDGPMCGSLYLTHENPDLHALFQIGREIVTFENGSGMVDQALHFLRRDEERRAVADAGRQRCVREHTWNHRIASLLAACSEATNRSNQTESFVAS